MLWIRDVAVADPTREAIHGKKGVNYPTLSHGASRLKQDVVIPSDNLRQAHVGTTPWSWLSDISGGGVEAMEGQTHD